MLALILGEAVPYAQQAIDTGKENPLWVLVAALAGILVVLGLVALWWIRKGHPDTMTARAAALKENSDRHLADTKARAEERALDRDMYRTLMAMATTSAQALVAEAHKEIGERVSDVQDGVKTVRDEVTANHNTSRDIHRMVGALVAKIGAGVAILGVLAFAAPAGPAEDAAAPGLPDLGSAPQTHPAIMAALPVEPGPRPTDICNPRCPAGQKCAGNICTILVRPKQPRPPRPRPIRKVADGSAPTPAPATPGPQSANYAVLTESWTDGKDPFDREPEYVP